MDLTKEVKEVGFHPTSPGFKGQSPLEETKVGFHPTSLGFKGQSPLEETKEVGFHPMSTGFQGQSPFEETKEQIPEEPSSDSSESTVESTVGENEDYLDVEELILYLVKMRKSKRLTELLVSKLYKLIKNKAGLQFAREDTDVIINNYISEIMFFSMRLLELAGKIQKLANISDDENMLVSKNK